MDLYSGSYSTASTSYRKIRTLDKVGPCCNHVVGDVLFEWRYSNEWSTEDNGVGGSV